jgi:hypothetical protein
MREILVRCKYILIMYVSVWLYIFARNMYVLGIMFLSQISDTILMLHSNV